MHRTPYHSRPPLGADEGFLAATLLCVTLGMVLPAAGVVIGAWDSALAAPAVARAASAARAPACGPCVARSAHVS